MVGACVWSLEDEYERERVIDRVFLLEKEEEDVALDRSMVLNGICDAVVCFMLLSGCWSYDKQCAACTSQSRCVWWEEVLRHHSIFV